jgi:hypothetical protein
MTITKVNTNYRTMNEYRVEGITTETNQEIIDACDRNAFGGTVYRGNNGTARVIVDID